MKPANRAVFLLHAVRIRSIAYSLTCEYNTGDKMTGHGVRGMASTMLHEQGWNTDVIERQLAHAERHKVKAAYNHAEYRPGRHSPCHEHRRHRTVSEATPAGEPWARMTWLECV